MKFKKIGAIIIAGSLLTLLAGVVVVKNTNAQSTDFQSIQEQLNQLSSLVNLLAQKVGISESASTAGNNAGTTNTPVLTPPSLPSTTGAVRTYTWQQTNLWTRSGASTQEIQSFCSQIMSPGVDLTIVPSSVNAVTSMSNGDKWTVKAKVSNAGPGSYSGPIEIAIATLTGSTIGNAVASTVINGIGPFEEKEVVITYNNVSCQIHSYHYFVIYADYNNVVSEKNENNNFIARGFRCAR